MLIQAIAITALAFPVLSAPASQHCDLAPISTFPNISTPLSTIESLGPYSPFISQTSCICRNLPHGLEIDQVNLISRHGARSPTASATTTIAGGLAKIKNITSTVDSSLAFIRSYNYTGFVADQLTNFGRKEMYDSGARYIKQYAHLANSSFFRTSGENRVIESSQWFLQGFNNRPFDLSLNSSSLLTPPVIISETDGLNNSVAVTNCPTFENYSPDLGNTAQANWLKVFATPITARLNAGLPGANFTNANILSFMSLCAFEGIKNTNYTASPWCTAFTAEEWKQNEYYYDVSKFYGHGWGNPYARAQYSGYVNEVLARLTEKPVLLGGAINRTLDSNSSTFPLGKTFYADFSHGMTQPSIIGHLQTPLMFHLPDNDMTSIMTAFNLWQEPDLLTTPNATKIPDHNYIVSKIVPFGSRFVFERLSDKKGNKFVRVQINDMVIPMPFANCGKYTSNGICALEAFVAGQAYATAQPSNFDKLCYSAQINKTVATTSYLN